jgi:acyl-CoA thioesterase-1
VPSWTIMLMVCAGSLGLTLTLAPEPMQPAKPAVRLVADPCPDVDPVSVLDLPQGREAVRHGSLVIVALGSSSTFGRGASLPDDAYPAQLQKALAARLPGIDVRVLNFGVNGQDAPEELVRMDSVIDASPDIVVWQLGTNAALRTENPVQFEQEVADGVRRLRTSGADVVLMDNQRCPMLSAVAGHGAAEDSALAKISSTGQASLFRRGMLMDEWVQTGKPLSSFLFTDGLHQNDLGYLCLSHALAAALEQGLQPR